METMMSLATLVMATVLALFSAMALQVFFLRAILFLMQPATAGRRAPRPAIERGSQLVARAYAGTR